MCSEVPSCSEKEHMPFVSLAKEETASRAQHQQSFAQNWRSRTIDWPSRRRRAVREKCPWSHTALLMVPAPIRTWLQTLGMASSTLKTWLQSFVEPQRTRTSFGGGGVTSFILLSFLTLALLMLQWQGAQVKWPTEMDHAFYLVVSKFGSRAALHPAGGD